jgi:hypothetical protein
MDHQPPQWARVFEVPGTSEGIQKTIEALGAKVIGSLELGVEGSDPRVLIATDVGLLNCQYTAPDSTEIGVRVVPWDAVPPPTVAYVWRGQDHDDAIVTFDLSLDPPVHAVFGKHAQKQRFSEFYAALRRLRL